MLSTLKEMWVKMADMAKKWRPAIMTEKLYEYKIFLRYRIHEPQIWPPLDRFICNIILRTC